MTDPLTILYESINDTSEPTINRLGSKVWRNRAGERHREDGPAVIYTDGTQEWRYNDNLHREDGPAVIIPNGTELWYYKNKLHREDGPAQIDKFTDTEIWWKHDRKHREDGPAIIKKDGTKSWWINNNLHREDGPAIMYPNGEEVYALDDNRMSKHSWLKDARVQKALKFKKLEDKETKDDDFLRTFGGVL